MNVSATHTFLMRGDLCLPRNRGIRNKDVELKPVLVRM